MLRKGLVSVTAGERGRRKPPALDYWTGDGLDRACWLKVDRNDGTGDYRCLLG